MIFPVMNDCTWGDCKGVGVGNEGWVFEGRGVEEAIRTRCPEHSGQPTMSMGMLLIVTNNKKNNNNCL